LVCTVISVGEIAKLLAAISTPALIFAN